MNTPIEVVSKESLKKPLTNKQIGKRLAIIFGCLFIVAFILYWGLVYFLVSASLVPSFMKKLDSFQKITDKSYDEMVWTDDITRNHDAAIKATNEWLKDVKYEYINVTSTDGYNFVGVAFLQEEYTEKWALVLHGYTGWKEEMFPFAYFYYQQGYNVLTPDLRCSGESEGDFIGMGWTDHFDCDLWLAKILEKNPKAQILLHGQSMGASTALMMTGEASLPENVKVCVSDCAYTTAYEMFGDKCRSWFKLPAFPIVDSCVLMLKMRGGYDLKKASAIDAVKNSDIPTLFIHGEEDMLISVSMAYRLYEAESCDKELLIVPGAGHAQSQDKDPQKYYETIENFIERYIP